MLELVTITAISIGCAVTRPTSQATEWRIQDQNWSTPLERIATEAYITDEFGCEASPTHAKLYRGVDGKLSRLQWVSAELDSYRDLKAGWDDEGSLAPDPAHISAAQQLLSKLPAGLPAPKPMIASSGEVGLYWIADSFIADLVIDSGDEFSVFIRSLGAGNKEVFMKGLRAQEVNSADIEGIFSKV